ncbi:MAG: glycosidase [Ruminobacter sp.]|nr:glycosidase [Ruminobacter sp.]
MIKQSIIATAVICAVMALAGCNSTAAPAKKFAWQTDDNPNNINCTRSGSTASVNLSAKDLNMSTTDNRGCFNSNNKFCDLRIYQVMVESFMHGANGAPGVQQSYGPSKHQGNLKGIIDNLDYIKSTGVNAIWLTPIFTVTKIEGQSHSDDLLDGTGYFTSDYFSIDPRFGTKEDMKKLVDTAHSKGIYVFLDGVFGHAKINVKTQSPKGNKLVLNRMCRDIGGYDDKMTLKSATCFKVDESMDFIKEVATYWIRELKIDGWRLDQAYQLDSKQWRQVREAIEAESAKKSNTYILNGKKVLPLGYTVAEIWSENPQEIEKNVFANDGVSSAFNFPLRSQLVRVLATREDPFTPGSCQAPAKSLNDDIIKKMNGYSRQSIMNNFLTNHDTVRFGDLLQRAKITVDGQNNRDYYDAHLTAMSFNAAMSGPLTVYYGDETGDDVKGFSQSPKNCIMLHQCDDHVSRSDGHVNNLTDAEEKLKENVSAVLNLRDTHPALAHGKRVHLYSDHSLYADFKQYEADKVIYVMNSGTGDRKITINNDVWGKLGLSSKCTMKSLFGGSVKDNVITAPALSGTFVNVTCR